MKALLQKGGRRVSLACDTRWGSQRDAVKDLLDNLAMMKSVCVDSDDQMGQLVPPSVQQMLFNERFISRLKELLAVLNPICGLIDRFQQNETCAADAVEAWNRCELPAPFQSLLEARRAMACTPVTLAANVLHPAYRGSTLSQEQRDLVDTYILDNLGASGIESYTQYVKREGVFGNLAGKATSSRSFWYFCKGHEELSKFALRLALIPASTAALERMFSSWSYIHTKVRNRLGFERSKKLMYIYFTLRRGSKYVDEGCL